MNKKRWNATHLLSLISIVAFEVISTIVSDAMQKKEIKDEVAKQLSENEDENEVTSTK